IEIFITDQWAFTVQRLADAINDPTQQLRTVAHALLRRKRDDACTGLQTVDASDRHETDVIAGKSHHFGFNPPGLGGTPLALAASGDIHPYRFQGHPHWAGETALGFRFTPAAFTRRIAAQPIQYGEALVNHGSGLQWWP